MFLVFSFLGVMNHVNCFADIEPALHPRDKSHLVVVNNFLTVLLGPVGYYLVEDFCIHVHQGNRSIALLFSGVFVWFWNQGNAGFHRKSLGVFLPFLFFGTATRE